MLLYLLVNCSEYPSGINNIVLLLWSNTAFQLLCDESMNRLYYYVSYDMPINNTTTPFILWQYITEPILVKHWGNHHFQDDSKIQILKIINLKYLNSCHVGILKIEYQNCGTCQDADVIFDILL